MSGSVARFSRALRFLLFVPLLGLLVSGCGFNNIPTYEEQAKAKWSEVQNQYQRRSDLIPNLVETVKGFVTFPGKFWATTYYSSNKPMQEFTIADKVKTLPQVKF